MRGLWGYVATHKPGKDAKQRGKEEQIPLKADKKQLQQGRTIPKPNGACWQHEKNSKHTVQR